MSLIGQPVEAVDTPALIVDYDVLTANLAALQESSDAAGIGVRPHIKAHKTPQIAQMQTRLGAIGVTAAKIGEAEVMATGGVEDIFIANCLVGEAKMRRLVALARRVPRLSVAVESLESARQLSAAFAAAGMTLDVMIEVDNGAQRCGVLPENVTGFAHDVAKLPALNIVGIMAYAAGAYACRTEEDRHAFTRQEGASLKAIADRLTQAGFEMRRISGGCTPTAGRYERGCGLTEVRCGTYCLNDYNQIDLQSCTRAQVAATVLATVVSHPTPERVLIDAGTKGLDQQVSPTTKGYGWLVDPPEANVVKINDEHGYLDGTAAHLRIGDKVRVIPPRICTCLNLYDEMVVVQDEVVVDVWEIAARGKNR
jgi:D-serine deaminase-like pyridoxal phosphate-dependent protein